MATTHTLTSKTLRRLTLLCLLPLLLAACEASLCPPAKDALPIEQIVGEYNHNALRVPRLWARAKVAMTFRKSPGSLGFTVGSTSPLAESNALLLLDKTVSQAPQASRVGRHRDFFLVIKEMGQEIARLGISTQDKVYYMWSQLGENRSALAGDLTLAGAPNIPGMPIDPTQLLSVLCVDELPADLTRPPLVAQSISCDPCAYILTVLDRQPLTNKLLFKREIYFDRRKGKPLRPLMVKVFDERGRRTLTATMKNWQPIEMLDVEDDLADPPAEMPTDIHLVCEETGAELHLVLSEMTTEDKVIPAGYLFWDRLPAALKPHVQTLRPEGNLPAPATRKATHP